MILNSLLIMTVFTMLLSRRTAISSLLKTLTVAAMPNLTLGAVSQIVQVPLSKLPRDAITILPMPSGEYEGKMLVDLPGKPNLHPKIRATGTHQRYDWKLLFADFTCWIDIQNGEAIIKTPIGSPTSFDLPMPTHYLGIPMKKIGEIEVLGDKELASVFEVKDAPIMKDRIFTGTFSVLDDGTVVALSGAEKNVAKNGKFSDVRMKMIEFHRGPQKPDVFHQLSKNPAILLRP